MISDYAKAAIEMIGNPENCAVISAQHPLPEILRATDGNEPDLDLFHFPSSLCSQKVRVVLAELGVTYGSNQLEILPPANENYAPEYVRLRLQSEAAGQSALASSWSGSSAVDTEGFDALVVPTLVDNRRGCVIADSKQICLYLARHYREVVDLIPADLEAEVLEQVDRVDQTPHPALLYGANPDGDTRPLVFQQMMTGIHQHKINAVKSKMALIGDEPELLAAYRKKIEKEAAAAEYVIDKNAMRSAVALSSDLVAALEVQLGVVNGPWVFGERFTLADVVWGVSLFRLAFLGYEHLWEGEKKRPKVASYLPRIQGRPSLKTAVIDWPK